MSNNHRSLPEPLRKALDGKSVVAQQHLERVWHLLDRAEEPLADVPDDDAAWADLQGRLDARKIQRRRVPDRGARKGRGRWLIGAGVAVLVVLLLGVFWWRQPVAVLAVAGEQITHILPDGSVVELNSDSRLRYTRGFHTVPFVEAGQRHVWLEGEAFFEVVVDGHPFVIETFNAQVEVLGTSFNVRARQARLEHETRVTLASGQVRVSAKQDLAVQMTLTEPGQESRIADLSLGPSLQPVQTQKLDQVLAWRANGFAVVDRPIAMILDELERRYALHIQAEDGLVLSDSMSLFFLRGASPEKILHDICLSQNCQYRRTSTGFVIFPARP